MCGIVGYIGKKELVPLLLEGLKKLEYRGYDSAGVCLKKEDGLHLLKRRGRIKELEKEALSINGSSRIGIAHTRWATHGEPNETNAHPHMDCRDEIAVVHNGIIENYKSLRELLQKENHTLKSATDSEVIAHLVEKFYSGCLEDAVLKTINILEGAYGLAIIHAKENKIVVARKGSPLILGVGEDEMFVASDATPILEHTKKVIYLNDNEIGILTEEGYTVKDSEGVELDSEVNEIKWSIDQVEKGGYDHFMIKEIFEQPQAIENTLRGHIKGDSIKLSVDVDLDRVDKVIITACGTSWHAGMIGEYFIEHIVGIPVEVDYASEFRYREPIITDRDLMIVISQSGETADTLGALRLAKEKGAQTLGIVNSVGSTITREDDTGIYLHAGPEIGVASTKAFTCQITALLLLAFYLKQQKGEKLDAVLLEEVMALPERVRTVLETAPEIEEMASTYWACQNFLYLGRGENFAVALEGALKLKEISYIHAEGYPAAEMKHGPIALIDEYMPVVFLATKGPIFEKVLSNMEEVRARKGRIITVTDEPDDNIHRLSSHVITVPRTCKELQPVINVIPLQLLAYYIAAFKGLDPDKPRNLAKSVTVE